MTARAMLIAAATVAVLAQLATSRFVTPTLLRWNTMPVRVLPKLLLWNASASAPRGLYWLRGAYPLHTGELVAVHPPQALAAFLAERGYLPRGVPLVKSIAALPGQTVCRHLSFISIDGRSVAVAHERDTHGRLLPVWVGCRTLRAGDVFLLNAAPGSFDGRYFGALPATTIIARAQPLWIVQEPSR